MSQNKRVSFSISKNQNNQQNKLLSSDSEDSFEIAYLNKNNILDENKLQNSEKENSDLEENYSEEEEQKTDQQQNQDTNSDNNNKNEDEQDIQPTKNSQNKQTNRKKKTHFEWSLAENSKLVTRQHAILLAQLSGLKYKYEDSKNQNGRSTVYSCQFETMYDDKENLYTDCEFRLRISYSTNQILAQVQPNYQSDKFEQEEGDDNDDFVTIEQTQDFHNDFCAKNLDHDKKYLKSLPLLLIKKLYYDETIRALIRNEISTGNIVKVYEKELKKQYPAVQFLYSDIQKQAKYAKLRNERNKTKIQNTFQLQQFLTSNKKTVEEIANPDFPKIKPFILDFQMGDGTKTPFKSVLSTKAQLEIPFLTYKKNLKLVSHKDDTHGMNDLGWSVLGQCFSFKTRFGRINVLGIFSNIDESAYLFLNRTVANFISKLYDEPNLLVNDAYINDGALAIRNANETFLEEMKEHQIQSVRERAEKSTQSMCQTHYERQVKQASKPYFKKDEKELLKQWKYDIKLFEKTNNEDQDRVLQNIIYEYWVEQDKEELVEYHKKTWSIDRKGFQGYHSKGSPNHNQFMEGYFSALKSFSGNRKLPILQCFEKLMEFLQKMSQQYQSSSLPLEFVISQETWELCIKFSKFKDQFLVFTINNKTIYYTKDKYGVTNYINRKTNKPYDQYLDKEKEVEQVLRQPTKDEIISFKNLKKIKAKTIQEKRDECHNVLGVRQIIIGQGDDINTILQNSYCSCLGYPCVHIITLLLYLKKIEPPVSLKPRKKRGRQAKNKPQVSKKNKKK